MIDSCCAIGELPSGTATGSIQMRWLIAGVALALAASGAQAQLASPSQPVLSGAGQIGQHTGNGHEEKEQKVKANEKAYDAALHNLPNKQYDPWHGVR
jgi:hypothetical protein